MNRELAKDCFLALIAAGATDPKSAATNAFAFAEAFEAEMKSKKPERAPPGERPTMSELQARARSKKQSST